VADIRFTYQALTAGIHETGIAGDFTSWEILEMKDLGGVHVITLPVETGKYRYKLIVDGVWMPDPSNPVREPDPFGGENSILIVKAPEAINLTWEEVYNDPALLGERIEHYIDIVRTGPESYDIRINWYPGLQCSVELLIDGLAMPCHRLGVVGNREVYHSIVRHEGKTFSLAARFSQRYQELYYGSFGFVSTPGDLVPHQVAAQELEIFDVPDWVAGSVIYQIFPDRFCNLDPSLNPDFREWYYDNCKTPPPPGEYLPPHREYYHFVEDWKDCSSLSQNPLLPDSKPDWWSFYGGDLPGVISQLGYLRELGVNLIYFNPLWTAKSNHKYDSADYRSIDPHFGDEAVMKELCSKARELGIRIILDVAFNHTGETFWAFRDCVEKGEDSPWWNWYDWKKWPLPDPLPEDFDPKEYYQCWWGIKDMPDLNYDLSRPHPAENYIRDIRKAVPNHALVEYLLDCVSWWLVDIGIDGFRLDVPDEVPYWFWELFRKHVKAIKPDAWLVGEIWHNAQGWVDRRYFDSVMNYAYFKNPLLDYFILKISAMSEFKTRIEEGLARYPFHACAAMMNLLGSHDTWRIASLAKDKLPRLKLAIVFQMCFVGAPHVYYGDEILMEGSRDPDNRRPFNWDWQSDPWAVEHRELIRELVSLRKQHNLLQTGEFAWLDASEDVIAFSRYSHQGKLGIWINLSDKEYSIPQDCCLEPLFRFGNVSQKRSGLILSAHAAVICPIP